MRWEETSNALRTVPQLARPSSATRRTVFAVMEGTSTKMGLAPGRPAKTRAPGTAASAKTNQLMKGKLLGRAKISGPSWSETGRAMDPYPAGMRTSSTCPTRVMAMGPAHTLAIMWRVRMNLVLLARLSTDHVWESSVSPSILQ